MPSHPNPTIHSKRMTRRLQLKKETLTCLSPKALAKANGGVAPVYPTCPCTFSCPSATACFG